MTRTVRRLLAGSVLLGSLAVAAPAAQATQGCFTFREPVTGRYYVVCT